MSWLLGNPDTSFWSDLTALPQNLAAGSLSEKQKQDLIASGKGQISQVVTNTYEHFKDMTAEQQAQVEAVANEQKSQVERDVRTITKPECSEAFNLSGIGLGCASFGDLATYVLFAVGALVALYLLVLFAPLGRRA